MNEIEDLKTRIEKLRERILEYDQEVGALLVADEEVNADLQPLLATHENFMYKIANLTQSEVELLKQLARARNRLLILEDEEETNIYQ